MKKIVIMPVIVLVCAAFWVGRGCAAKARTTLVEQIDVVGFDQRLGALESSVFHLTVRQEIQDATNAFFFAQRQRDVAELNMIFRNYESTFSSQAGWNTNALQAFQVLDAKIEGFRMPPPPAPFTSQTNSTQSRQDAKPQGKRFLPVKSK